MVTELLIQVGLSLMRAFEKAIFAKMFSKPGCFEKILFLRVACLSLVGFAGKAGEDFKADLNSRFDHVKFSFTAGKITLKPLFMDAFKKAQVFT